MENPVRIGNNVTLYLGDCREILPTLGNVDAVVTDPPYGLDVDYGMYDDTRKSLIELAPQWIAAAKLATDRIVCTPGVTNLWLYPEPYWTMCWAISGAGARGKWGFNCWQPILCYGADPYLTSGKGARPDLIFVNETSEKNGHPCPKPLGFMKRLVDRSSLIGETVCDPFMGSGTTGAACVNLGRQFVGIELEPKFFDIACRRIEETTKQSDLFIEKRAAEIQQTLELVPAGSAD